MKNIFDIMGTFAYNVPVVQQKHRDMSKHVNKIFLLGNVGQEPELRHTAGGTAVCNVRMCTNESFKNASGEWQERPEWHDVVCWGKTAEVASEYLKKGDLVHFIGSKQTREWKDKEGNDRRSCEIRCHEMSLISSSSNGRRFDESRDDMADSPPPPKDVPSFEPNDDLPF